MEKEYTLIEKEKFESLIKTIIALKLQRIQNDKKEGIKKFE
jgi:hypothetical protein